MKEWDIKYCGLEAFYLDKRYINLFQEVLGVIDELERIYKSTSKKLLMCSKKIKWKFDKKKLIKRFGSWNLSWGRNEGIQEPK